MKKPPIVGAAVVGRVHEGLMLRSLQQRQQGRRLALAGVLRDPRPWRRYLQGGSPARA
jgi:hypothetical protein